MAKKDKGDKEEAKKEAKKQKKKGGKKTLKELTKEEEKLKKSLKEKSLVIVESPAKSKTINKILGSSYEVTSCMGHVRDLPVRPRGGDIGVDLENNFEPRYKILNKKKDLVKELKFMSDSSKSVILATDPDREGEAIAWHLVSALKLDDSKYKRITFNEITKDAITEAVKNPRDIAIDLVNAQQARRIIDRIVGYKLSPLLWEKIATRLSAGRVQSVALKFIIDREREIKVFKPEEYWLIFADFTTDGTSFETKLSKIAGKTAHIKNKEETDKILDELNKSDFTVTKVQQKERLDKPYPPFKTSLLQQRASSELGYTSKRTMMIAQRLYEGISIGEEGPVGLITYMRTDSLRIADSALKQTREFIKENYGDKYLPETANIYKSKGGGGQMQDAHECIRPTDVRRTPQSIKKYLRDDQYKLYSLIWRRFVASQMTPARYDVTEVYIEADKPRPLMENSDNTKERGKYLFTTRGRQLKFSGYYKVYGTKGSGSEQQLPPLKEGTKLDKPGIRPVQKFTEPPPRYSEASLIKILEKHGIGRPSTYVPTLSTIQSRGYVISKGRQLVPTELGFLVMGQLEKHMSEFLNTEFTAQMEQELDRIEEGKVEWVKVLDKFYDSFAKELEKASQTMEQIKDMPEGKCEKCGGDMLVNWNRNGKKLVCSTEECGNTIFSPANVVQGEFCEQCSAEMVIKLGRFGKFMACSKYPDCRFTKTILKGDRIVKVPNGEMLDCPECKEKMIVRYTRRGPFLGCSKYPDCKGIQRLPKEWIIELVTGSDKLAEEEKEEKEGEDEE